MSTEFDSNDLVNLFLERLDEQLTERDSKNDTTYIHSNNNSVHKFSDFSMRQNDLQALSINSKRTWNQISEKLQETLPPLSSEQPIIKIGSKSPIFESKTTSKRSYFSSIMPILGLVSAVAAWLVIRDFDAVDWMPGIFAVIIFINLALLYWLYESRSVSTRASRRAWPILLFMIGISIQIWSMSYSFSWNESRAISVSPMYETPTEPISSSNNDDDLPNQNLMIGTPGNDIIQVQVIVVALKNVNIRSGAGLDYYRISFLRDGETANVIGTSPDRAWWKITCANKLDKECWITASETFVAIVYGDPNTVPVVMIPIYEYAEAALSPTPLSPLPSQEATIPIPIGTPIPLTTTGPNSTFILLSNTRDSIGIYKPNDTIIFEWEWHGKLTQNEYLEIRVGPAGDNYLVSQGKVTIISSTSLWRWKIPIKQFINYSESDYEWQIVLMAGDTQTILAQSERGYFRVLN